MTKDKELPYKPYPNRADEPVHQLSDIDLTGFYSYANYLRWEIDERLELIRGHIYQMAASSVVHQVVAGTLTVVQPDICVVCDLSKLDPRGCIGSPDIMVEVLSPGNNKKELNLKFHLYEEFGIKEYWVVHPVKKSLMKYELDASGKYEKHTQFTADGELRSALLPGFNLNLKELFP